MPSIRAPAAKKATTLTVAVKCRPLTERERGRDIVRVNDDKEVLVLDPDLSKDYLDRIQNRTKERQYSFDYAFGPDSANSDVYKRSISSTIGGVIQGLNATVFAYGSTGSGKTYTMVGTQDDPGLMVLSLHTIFDLIKKDASSDDFEVTCSYLEVYNEVIYDLLEKSSGHLELREDPEKGIVVAGLRCIKSTPHHRRLMAQDATTDRHLKIIAGADSFGTVVKDATVAHLCSLRIDVEDLGTDKYYSVAEEIGRRVSSAAGTAAASPTATQTLGLVACGTGVSIFANKSHAVLEITVTRKQRNKYRNQVIRGKLALVDLAGSERASETNSGGQKLRDGANINRSLLALANCINALGKQQKKGLAYVPYRNSKLTRILKDGLSGNSQTIMIATISPADSQYHHTVNTLKYADRAKEIKTHIQKNINTVDTHVSDYQRMIDSLQIEVCRLKKELAEKESQLSTKPTEKAVNDELPWLNVLSQETSENVQERINLQKALFELEETNLRNRTELQHLDDAVAKQQAIENEGAVVQALRARRQVILDNIRDNDETGINYQKEIEANEMRRCQLQEMIEEAVNNNGNKTYLHILGQYRLLGMANTELQFEMAMRDQVIHSQREAQRNLWNVLMGLGLDEKRILGIAAKQGITIEDWTITPHLGLSDRTQIQNTGYGSSTRLSYCPCGGQSFAKSSCIFQQNQDFRTRSPFKGNWELCHAFCREEHHSSYYYMSHDPYSPTYSSQRGSSEHCLGDGSSSQFDTPDRHCQDLQKSAHHMRTQPAPYKEASISTPTCSADFGHQQKDAWTNIARQQPYKGSHLQRSGSSDLGKGMTICHGRSMPGLFGYSPISSDHISPSLVPLKHPNMSQLLSPYAARMRVPPGSLSPDSHPSPFV
ncbi:hypothetical protein RJ640_030643 [Escallonia rubra]|uniref:Kinesin-like protein n=1 Tax=Escallonia rubra TaxID=112253 RepID=A0AA88QYI0_9ASTE|nr:hypothetical protein RJ640_030643 [Escallonia rubra]